MSSNGSILSTVGTTKVFGGLLAVSDVSINVRPLSIVSIIGPNGAGKTTFFNMLTGLYRPTAGRILFDGQDVTARRPDIITSLGVARTFQNIRLFSTMTALENVMVGCHARMNAGLFGSILRVPAVRREESDVTEKAREMLTYVGLAQELHDQTAANLSYGDQRRVEIARALAADPTLLLLDEPTAGMNPRETLELRDHIVRMRDELGLTVVVIEHDMRVVKGVSDRVIACDYGQKIAEGTYDEVAHDERVVEAYLGTKATE
jgi:branched-chain amino acid transport system ATP-binding protein